MYVTKVKLRNIACFEDLELDFTNADGKPRMMTVLLGENMAGKTMFSKAVCLALAGETAQTILVSRPDDYHRQQARGLSAECRVSIEGGADAVFVPVYPNEPTPAVRPTLRRHNVVGYGTNRLALREDRVDESRLDRRIAPYESLFDDRPHLLPYPYARFTARMVAVPFAGSDDPAVDEEAAQIASALYQHRSDSFEEVIRNMVGDKVTLTETGSALGPLFHFDGFDGVDLAFGQLSDGYRAAFTLAGDLYRRLLDMTSNPGLDDPRLISAVVLIDEIDLLLHPRWQRVVLQGLRDAFPNVQFIVTTHSPVTSLGAKEGEIVVLKREGNHVVAKTDLPSVAGWRADQLLVSDFFGLPTAVDVATEDRIKEYRALAARSTLNAEETAKLHELAAALVLLPYRLPGIDRAAIEVGLQDAEQLAKAQALPEAERQRRQHRALEALRRAAEKVVER
jgi:predicted ATP-binding protein involved in virulence